MPRFEITYKRVETIESSYTEIIEADSYTEAEELADENRNEIPSRAFASEDSDTEVLVNSIVELPEDEDDEEEDELSDDEEF